MTLDEQRAYVRQWVETGRQLESIRWRELRGLDPTTALRASDALIASALLVPLPETRRVWSGLVDLQTCLRAATRP